jgi:hypothetical protein
VFRPLVVILHLFLSPPQASKEIDTRMASEELNSVPSSQPPDRQTLRISAFQGWWNKGAYDAKITLYPLWTTKSISDLENLPLDSSLTVGLNYCANLVSRRVYRKIQCPVLLSILLFTVFLGVVSPPGMFNKTNIGLAYWFVCAYVVLRCFIHPLCYYTLPSNHANLLKYRTSAPTLIEHIFSKEGAHLLKLRTFAILHELPRGHNVYSRTAST